ncbi:unnamed protein product [Porites lobata]|uniref:Uncharacterized protein n=1 Tax=Porites lobata TaxID=104759 RepID=A0ABN8N7A1_9CNID|nr:unnamed protein product [Porites lobata]
MPLRWGWYFLWESQYADHCRVFAFSDPEDHLCEHEHTKSCQSCDNIKNVLEEIELVLSSRDLHFRTPVGISSRKRSLFVDTVDSRERPFTGGKDIRSSAGSLQPELVCCCIYL